MDPTDHSEPGTATRDDGTPPTKSPDSDAGQDPRDTDHPASDEHAQRNIDNEPAG